MGHPSILKVNILVVLFNWCIEVTFRKKSGFKISPGTVKYFLNELLHKWYKFTKRIIIFLSSFGRGRKCSFPT